MIALSELLEEVRSLGLTAGEYVLAGSVPMGLAGLRAVNDVDVIVSDRAWAELARRYPVEYNSVGAPCIHVNHVEILNSWYGYTGDASDLIAQAEVVGGFPVMPLEWVLQWKRLSGGRPKDLADIERIELHLGCPPPPSGGRRASPPEDDEGIED